MERALGPCQKRPDAALVQVQRGGKRAAAVPPPPAATATPAPAPAFTFDGQNVITLIVIDSAFENGQLIEVAIDYFAQSDDVANHDGAWLYGVHTDKLGLLVPASSAVGQRFRSEDVPGITAESDEVVSRDRVQVVCAGRRRRAGDPGGWRPGPAVAHLSAVRR